MTPRRAAIIKYVQNGGGIAGVHNATDMGTGATSWDWWDGNNAQLGRRHDDEGSRRDRPQQHRHGPGRGQQPPLDPRPRGHVPARRRALQLQPQRPRRPPRARQPRRAHVHAGRQRHGPGPPDHVVQALRRRQPQRRHRDRQVLQRRPHLGHGAAATSAPSTPPTAATTRSSSRSSAASAGSPARAASPTARAPSGPPSPARSSSPTPTTRSGSTSPRTGRSTGRRSVTRSASPPRATSRCTTRPSRPATRRPSSRSRPARTTATPRTACWA